jgi:putative transposase
VNNQLRDKPIENKELYKNKYRKASMRLQGWNYCTPAFYFITMRTFNGISQFGKIHNSVMVLNDIGEMVSKIWKDSFEIRKELVCDTYIIMPNHIHGLINIDVETHSRAQNETHSRAQNETHSRAQNETHSRAQNETHSRASLRRMPKSISSFVAGFKSTSTKMVNEYWNRNGERLWQTGYYDRIIRNETELLNVRNYIQCNPMAWDKDEENPDYKINVS